jgi:FKBP-type peptidyl-prolyl cis-trans isomerase SlpA
MEQGLMINFTDSAGNDQPGVIKTFDANQATVDFNHPLAGRDILFKVKIFTIAEQ